MWSNTYGCKIQRSGVSGSYIYSVASDYANRPVNYVSFNDAMRFTNWLQNGQPTGLQNLTTTEDGAYYINGVSGEAALASVSRKAIWSWAVTTENEWYKAAYYKGGSINAGYWLYPTQSNTIPGRDMNDISGNNANNMGLENHPIDGIHYTTEAGEFQNSDSYYGTFDQAGNVWEWNENVINGSYRGVRGGCFSGNIGLESERSYYNERGEDYQTGFRVVQVPEPASLSLLGIAVLAIIRRRSGGR